ncbi:hypothetical protein BGZ70_009949 [Mortierella alpina]|uniref:Uncharacterized protein n=1 Tax=Mortierella alpina TaxID=64518 RepID=A0A9P6JCV6_MORAP|nr:hypothetical protein BGZ70_009949 [Mortierella alpina]
MDPPTPWICRDRSAQFYERGGPEGWGPLSPDRTDFTLCFEYSVMYAATAAVALLVFTARIHHLRKAHQPHHLGRTAWIYWFVQGFMFAASSTMMAQAIQGVMATSSAAYVIGTLLMGTAWLCALPLNYNEHKYTIRSSNSILSFFVLSIAVFIVNLHTLYDLGQTAQPQYRLTMATLIFLALGFVVEAWPRGSTHVQQQSGAQAYEKANMFSRLSIHFYQPIISLAAKKKVLTPDDIVHQLPEKHNTEQGYTRLAAAWEKKVQRHEEKVRNAVAAGDSDRLRQIKKPSLLATILITQWRALLPVVLLRIIIPFFELVQPALLGLLLDYIQESSSDESDGHPRTDASKAGPKEAKPLSYGLALAFAMYFASAMTSVLYADFLRRTGLVGTETKSALVGMIYRKALRLSPDAKKQSSSGAVTNHMSVDATYYEQAFDELSTWVTLPFSFILCLYLLYTLLGWSFMAGVVTILAFVPFQAWRASVYEGLEEERLKTTDERVRLVSEVLSNIKIVKLYGWESAFKKSILAVRNAELRVLKKIGTVEAIMSLVFASSSIIVSFVTFTVYVTVGHGVLTPKVVFVSITLFDMLHGPVARLAEVTTDTISLIVATRRIQRFLFREEIDDHQIIREKLDLYTSDQNAIEIHDATLSWTSGKPLVKDEDEEDEEDEEYDGDDPTEHQGLLSGHGDVEDVHGDQPLTPAFQNLHLTIQHKTLTAVVGRVGQGKSSLLSAIIGEMYKLQGTIRVRGEVAYVPQQAWILNATLRDNILFGKPFDQERYRHVLDVCGLEPDLAMLPAGDQTEIGERGINLSGGQKQRVSLARATYQDADIYLLDDPLSAVDAHVDQHLWNNLIGPQGLLKDKTRILVTHGIHHLDQVDKIVVMKGGEIVETGHYEKLMAARQSFYELIKEYSAKHSRKRRNSHAVVGTAPSSSQMDPALRDSSLEETDAESDNATIEESGDSELLAKKQLTTVVGDGCAEEEEDELIAEETMKKGGIEWNLVKTYVKAGGVPLAVTIVLTCIIPELCLVGTSLWLKHWITKTKEELDSSLVLFLGVYAALTLVFVLLYIVYLYLILAVARIRASELIHERLLTTVLRLPMSFFDTTPIGRIVNRFSSDCFSIDEHLPWKFLDLIFLVVSVSITLVMISVTTPVFVALIPLLAVVYYFIQDYYLWATRSLKRINSTSLSPLYQHFDETLNGVATIRAMAVQPQFIQENTKRTDYHSNAFTAYRYSDRWVELRLQWLGSTIIFIIALSGVLGRSTLDPSLVGLALKFAMGVTDDIMWLCRDFSEWQSHLVAIERVQEYTDKHTEAPEKLERSVPAQWPDQGRVVFRNFSARYREGLDLVVKNLSFEVQPCEKIGIVGRTGAGKSSLTLALFRIIEAANSDWARASDNSGYHASNKDRGSVVVGEREPLLAQPCRPSDPDEEIDGGSIEIDGIDIATLGLADLRRHLAIIPQDPTLFAGTVRSNLDPFQEAMDADLWAALDRAHLKDAIRHLPGGLSAEVAQGGENFSVGQRSLLCLARALLRPSKILILDEATAAVDVETDELIQRTIREVFKDRTVLTIAHRIKTVMDASKILVMEQGQVVEFEAPGVLLQQPDSLFFKLAHQAGEVAM